MYILLDAVASQGFDTLGNWLFDQFTAGEQAHIFLRMAAHPYRVSLGYGPFRKTLPYQVSTYHEKYVCVTGLGVNCAMVGGIDFGPDQYSPPRHGWRCDPADYQAFCVAHVPGGEDYFQNEIILWHDIAVKIDGQVAAQYLIDDFTRRWNAGNGTRPNDANLPAPALAPVPGGPYKVQLVKTENVQGGPRVTRNVANGLYYGTRDAWQAAVREARHYIYIENQYIRDQPFCDALCDALRKNSLLQVIVVVPFQSEEEFRGAAAMPNYESKFGLSAALRLWFDPAKRDAFQDEIVNKGLKIQHGSYLAHRFVEKLRAAGGPRCGLFALANATVTGAPEMIYPHSKIMIVDDTWAYVGSANANGKSLKIDGEVGYVIHDRAAVTAFRRQLWFEHLQVNWPTRDIRDFLTRWKATAVSPAKAQVADCTAAELAVVQAVALANVPAGQKYDGPGSSMNTWDDEV